MPLRHRRWSSFHLHLPGSHARFLAERLAPWLEAEAGSYRRFFYLRHADGGLHLRLRFLPRGARLPESVRRGLDGCAAACVEALERASGTGGPAGYRLEEHPYSRSDLYFGDTPASVHAELLNEASSWLALRLLGTPGAQGREHRWLLLAGALAALLAGSADDEADRLRALDESRAFAARLAVRTGAPGEAPASLADGPGRAVRQGVPRVVSALADDPGARRLARLLRRTRARCPDGRFVATHALHLFANKLGFSVAEELRAFAALDGLSAPAADAPAAEPGLRAEAAG